MDATKHCYGHAFVLLAYATAMKAGIPGMDARFRRPGNFSKAASGSRTANSTRTKSAATGADFAPIGDRTPHAHDRGNVAAYEATGEVRYLDRAETLARRICVRACANAQDVVWETIGEDWSIDWDYNKDDPKHLFRPYVTCRAT